MERISEIYDRFIDNQILLAVESVVQKRVKIASLFVPQNRAEAVVKAVRQMRIFCESYTDGEFSLVLIYSESSVLNYVDEVNRAPMSKELKDSILDEVFTVKNRVPKKP